jgi:thiamine pyrophosphate-dependent acetolactate synthase large subunit-like protein
MSLKPRTGGQILIDQLGIHGADHLFCVPGESYLAALRPYGNAPIAAARAGRSSAIEIVIGVAMVRIAPGTDVMAAS